MFYDYFILSFCGICNVCVGIIKGLILDVIEIDVVSNIGVDNIRELIERF